ncbi:hypothetical protein GCM10007111_27810 [Virgibacillus kapii]|uniref:Uncharacterized protein n=1 Tax=Virgibacillus kapii TaxID=1638645 RepID=A0ABQ2DMK7_9BACI|nr:hypothetical protein GCM10007111_27810 [Virgibacillus kapii]
MWTFHYAREMIDNGMDKESAIAKVLKRFAVPNYTTTRQYLEVGIEKRKSN